MHNSRGYRSLTVERISKSENHLSCAKLGSASDWSNAAKWARDSQRREIEFAISRYEPSRRSRSGRELHIVNLRIRDMRIRDDQTGPPYSSGPVASFRPADLDRYLAHTRSYLTDCFTSLSSQLAIQRDCPL